MLFKTTDGVSRLHGCWMSDQDITSFINTYATILNAILRKKAA
jgi:hypothetical protein